MKTYIVTFDQGTTASRSILFDENGLTQGISKKEIPSIFPQEGWVEQDPNLILKTQLEVTHSVLKQNNIMASQIAAIGITNQRETTIVWNRHTGVPIYNGIVWQCRRTAEFCQDLKKQGLEGWIHQRTGLLIDAYFSATKIRWILETVPEARQMAEQGDLLFGTVDTWLIWNLTKGKVHVTDYSNASRTMLFNIHTLTWDQELLALFNIPKTMLPQVKGSSEVYGTTSADIFGWEIPIASAIGDQQGALFGQTCFLPGEMKNTYGTGGFLLMNTGESPVCSQKGLLTTIAWGIDGKVTYALEGSVFVVGAAINWLRDQINLIEQPSDTEAMAYAVQDTNGVYMVPAFVGLGAPYWDTDARGTIVGITLGTKREHIVRAVLEAIAYQTYDVVMAMKEESGIDIKSLNVDGGVSVNEFLMQFQADILGVKILRPFSVETTALGAAYLAGLAVGYYKDQEELCGINMKDKVFHPTMEEDKINQYLSGWKEAIERTLTKKCDNFQ